MGNLNFTIETLGPCNVASPVPLSNLKDDGKADFVSEEQHILYNIVGSSNLPEEAISNENMLELAGPRSKIYFEPEKTHAAIVTCGGLCPGLNDVIR